MVYFLLHNTLSAGLLALAAMLVCRWRRAHPALRHALWLVVMAKLVAPPLPVWSFAWPSNWSTLWATAVTESPSANDWRPTPLRANVATHQGLPLPGAPESFVVLDGVTQVLPPVSPELGADSTAYAPLGWIDLLTWEDFNSLLWRGWLAAIAGMAIYQGYRWHRVQQLLDRASLAPEWLVDEVAAVAREFSLRAPEVCVLKNVRCTPFVWVLGRVQLLWPESMLDGFSPESRRTIIAHELAHLARRDHWVARFVTGAALFWWWHPLFWYVRAMLHDAAEQACDARVTQFLPAARKAYAQALIEVCELLAPGITPGPALGVGSQTRRAFERRLTMIMREKIASRLSLGAVAGVGLLALVVLPGFTPAQDAPPAPSTSAVPAQPPVATAPAAEPAQPNVTIVPVLRGELATGQPTAPSTPTLTPALPPPTPDLPPSADFPQPAQAAISASGTLVKPQAALPGMSRYWAPAVADEMAPEEVVHLTRATYRLPAELAQPFSVFLNNTLGSVVQSSVQVSQQPVANPAYTPEVVSRIVVTADEETQRIVGHFIGLLRTHGSVSPSVAPAAATLSGALLPTMKYAPSDAAANEPQPPAFDQPAQKAQPKFAPGYPVQALDENGQVPHPNYDAFGTTTAESLPGPDHAVDDSGIPPLEE